MDQREGEADGQRREAGRRAGVRGAHDDQQEKERQHDLGNEGGGEGVTAGRMRAIAVGGEALREGEIGMPDSDDVKDRRGTDRTDNLSDPIGQDVRCRDPAARPQAEGDGWVVKCPPEMCPTA